MRPAWRRGGGRYTLVTSPPITIARTTTLDLHGVSTGLMFRRSWPWHEVEFVTWDRDGIACYLALCRRGDTNIKLIPGGTFRSAPIRALLEPIAPFVEEMGSHVANPDQPARTWWYLHPASYSENHPSARR